MNKITKALRKSASTKSNHENNNKREISTIPVDNSKNIKIDTDKNDSDNKKNSDVDEDEFEENKEFQCHIENKNTSLQNLSKYCEYLETINLHATDILNKTYGKHDLSELRKRLRRQVNELMILQREIQTISNSIDALKMQIQAVKSNKKDHKRKLRQLKSREYRTKATLNNEKKIQNNAAKSSQIPVPKIRKLAPSKSVTNCSRQYGETLIFPWLDNLAVTDYNNNNDNNRSNNTNVNNKTGPQITIPKRMKNNHQKRRLLLRAQSELQEIEGHIEEKGVTLYITPIGATQHNENEFNNFRSTSTTTCNTMLNWQWPD